MIFLNFRFESKIDSVIGKRFGVGPCKLATASSRKGKIKLRLAEKQSAPLLKPALGKKTKEGPQESLVA